ncbi:MAG: hypothetical protein IPM16_09490 [Chloroflexi bacterium]|nr:hypothetical protein [Chloroflexota bacterium]
MIENLAKRAHPILWFSPIRRLRRNHALEHATVHMLQRKMSTLRVSGVSQPFGFILLHNADPDAVEAAVHEALKRMRAGEHNLAIHPSCGTNLIVQGTLAALVGLFMLWGRRRLTGQHFSRTVTFMAFAIMAGQPLGMSVQKHVVTEGDPGDLAVKFVHSDEIRFPTLGRKINVTLVMTEGG